MILPRRDVRVFTLLTALAFLAAATTSAEAGRRYRGSFGSYGSSGGSSGSYGSSGGSSGSYGSSGGSSGSYGSYGSSGGSSGSYGSRGGLFRRRALRRGSHGSSGGYYHSSGSYGSSGGSYGSSGGYSYGSYGSSGGYSYGSFGSSGSSGGVILHHAPAVVRPHVPSHAPVLKAPAPKAGAPKLTPAPTPKKKDGQARMTIMVPADAVVFLNNQRMKLTGSTRQFISPELSMDNAYAYTVRVEVVRDGKTVTTEQKQIIRAGENYALTFIEQNGTLVFVDPSVGNIVASH